MGGGDSKYRCLLRIVTWLIARGNKRIELMGRYVIGEVNVDGYERYAAVKGVEDGKKLIVHFLEYDEYIESSVESKKRRIGDILEGEIAIGLVSVDKKVNAELMHRQLIPISSHIEAVVQVYRALDDYSVLAFSSLAEDKILVEFEHRVNYQNGDMVYLEGSLEFNLIFNEGIRL